MTPAAGAATRTSRASAIEVAESYLQGGLVAHSTVLPRLSPRCFRHENGWDTGTADVIREHFPFMTMCVGVRDERWVVEGPHVALRYELLLTGRTASTIPVAEFFTIGPDGIEEIGATFPLARWMNNALGPGSAELRGPRPAIPRFAPEADIVALGEQVVAAIVTGGKPPWAEDVTVGENGRLVARGSTESRAALTAGTWARVIEARTQEWVAEGSAALGRVELEQDDGELIECAVYVRSFGGLVRELDLIWGPGPGPKLVAAWQGER